MKVFISVTKAKPYLFYQSFIYKKDFGKYVTSMIKPDESDEEPILNGKIVASFDLNVAEYIANYSSGLFFTSIMNQGELLEKSCLKYDELKSYLKKGHGYAWHIDALEIFEKPWTLKSFMSADTTYPGWEEDWRTLNEITKAPQSWMYAVAYYEDGNCEPCILVSIRSTPSCDILNLNKSLEMRGTCPKGVRVEGGQCHGKEIE